MDRFNLVVFFTMALITVSLEFARYQVTQACTLAGHILQQDELDLRLRTDGIQGGGVMKLDCGMDWWSP